MVKIYYIVILLIITICSINLFSNERKSSCCIQYASEYIEVKSGIVTTCQLNKEENIFYCKENRANYSDTYFFRHWTDFIKERNNFGTMRYYKYQKSVGDKEYTFYYKYDNNHRLIQEHSSSLVMTWTRWDKRGRNITGKYNLAGNCQNRIINIKYDDIKRTISIISSGGKETAKNGCKKLPLSLYYELDSGGNTILSSSVFHSGLVNVKGYKILKHETVCY